MARDGIEDATDEERMGRSMGEDMTDWNALAEKELRGLPLEALDGKRSKASA